MGKPSLRKFLLQQSSLDLLEIWESLSSTSLDGFWVSNMRGDLLLVNDAYCRMSGYSRKELLKLSVADLEAEDTPDEMLSHNRKIKEDGTDRFETRHRTKNGEFIDLEVSVTHVKKHAVNISFLQNITEKKTIEKALRNSEAYQRQIINNAPFGVHFYTLDHQDELVFEGGNPSGDQILGITLEDLVGKTIHKAFPGLSKTEIPAIYQRLAREGGTFSQDQVDYEEGAINGAFEVQAFQTVPGKIAVFFNDVTERKRNEQELIRAREEALQANRAKDDFLGVMSHELRTPLTPIIGFTEILSLQTDDPTTKNYLNHINEAAQRMLRLVEDILKYSHLSSTPPLLQLQPFFPGAFFQRELQRFESIAEDNHLVLEKPHQRGLDALAEGLTVVSDPEIIAQILNNLISNSCKFTDNGTITLRYDIESSADNHALLVFEVEDTGAGISDDKQSCIWEPFTQGDNSASRSFQGVGLGLAICRRLVSHLKGEIELDSTPGVGSRFKVRIPVNLQQVDPETFLSLSPTIPHFEQAPRILIIEDNDLNRLILESQIHTMGGETALAIDGEDALELIRRQGLEHFDLILLDLHLPGMDGLELYDTICNHTQDQTMPPVIAISADASNRNRSECLNRGMRAFLEKPVRLSQLHPVIQEWLPSSANRVH